MRLSTRTVDAIGSMQELLSARRKPIMVNPLRPIAEDIRAEEDMWNIEDIEDVENMENIGDVEDVNIERTSNNSDNSDEEEEMMQRLYLPSISSPRWRGGGWG